MACSDNIINTLQERSALRQDLEQKVSEWSRCEASETIGLEASEARQAWEQYETVTRSLSHELCEQLRLILEPTQAAKLRLLTCCCSMRFTVCVLLYVL